MQARETVDRAAFNGGAILPYQLRLQDFEIAMQDVYDFFYDVNSLFFNKGLPRLDDNLRPAILSGMLSDMLTASMAAHARALVQNTYFNGHPDLVVGGRYPPPQKRHKIRRRGRRDQDDAQTWRRRRHAWRSRSVDVRVRLRNG